MKDPIKIVHITYARVNQPDPELWLDHLSFFVGILEEMAKRHSVESIHLGNHTRRIKRNNVCYHFLDIKGLHWLFPIRLNRYIAACRPDVVVVHGWVFTWQVFWLRMQRGNDVKLVIQHHAEAPFPFPKNLLQKLIDSSVYAYFFSSIDLARPWLEASQIRNRNNVHEALELSSPFYSPSTRTPEPAPGTYLWVGRFDENKDALTLVHAFTRFLETHSEAVLRLVFRGGNLTDEVRSIVSSSRFQRNIVFDENVRHEEMEHRYRKSAFIISSSRYESTGAAVLEAMSCGCIPVLTNIPAFRTLTRNGEVGLLFEPGEVSDLVTKLISTTRMDIAGERQRVFDQFRENLSFQAIANKMLTVITGRA